MADTAAHRSTPDAAEAIADHILAARYEKLSAATVASAKAGILDTIGCAFAGTGNAEIARVGEIGRAHV